MGKFKVGDLVMVRKDLEGRKHYNDVYFNERMEPLRGLSFEIAFRSVTETESETETTYRLKGIDSWSFNDEMLEPVTKELTLLEVLNNIQEGERWVDTKASEYEGKYRKIKPFGYVGFIEKTDTRIIIDFDGSDRTDLYINTNEGQRFVLEEKRTPTVIYNVEHSEGGKLYSFLSDDKLEVGDFVVCNTSMGRSYGRVKSIATEDKTEEELKKYKKCWRAC